MWRSNLTKLLKWIGCSLKRSNAQKSTKKMNLVILYKPYSFFSLLFSYLDSINTSKLILSLLALFLFSCSSSDKELVETNSPLYCEVWEEIEAFANSSEMNTKADWDKKISLIEKLVSNLPKDWEQTGLKYLNIVKARAELLGQYNYVSSQELPNGVLKEFIDKYYSDQKEADKLIDFLKTVC